MRLGAGFLLVALIPPVMASCAKPTLYQAWGQQLADMSLRDARLEDVSMLLGGPPSYCETVEGPHPLIGLRFDEKLPVVAFVYPGSPAEQAGLAAGDVVSSISGQAVRTTKEAVDTIRVRAREGEPLEVNTSRGDFLVSPAVPDAKQCYWEVRAGGISRAGGAAVVNQWGGSAGASSAAYQRFFRASCRVNDGYVAGCQSNWQE